MLRQKLLKSDNSTKNTETPENEITSKHFCDPFWNKFYQIECNLNKDIKAIKFESRITHIYNPIEYAWDLHCAYLRKYLKSTKTVMFVGMNPGPNGMGQTGVPFGNIETVKTFMELQGDVKRPEVEHPKRKVVGLSCKIEEPSGVRIWTLLKNIAGSLDTFAEQCFIHNFCPYAFFDSLGKNVTPSELKGPSKKEVRDVCLKYLDQEIDLIQPKILIAVGRYVSDCLQVLFKEPKYNGTSIKILQLPHPSPRSVNNNNWPEKAKKFFEDNDLIKYIKNEI